MGYAIFRCGCLVEVCKSVHDWKFTNSYHFFFKEKRTTKKQIKLIATVYFIWDNSSKFLLVQYTT